MSRYYFDLHNGEGPLRDDHGQELASKEKLSWEITRILLDIARDEMPVQDCSVIELTVRDDHGRAVAVANVTFNTRWL